MDSRQQKLRVLGALAIAMCLVFMGSSTALAQSANIGGVVTDQTGGALPGVTVTITNKNNGAVQTLVTGTEGNFRAVALQPAPYEINAELSGFATVKRERHAHRRRRLTVDLKLGVASLDRDADGHRRRAARRSRQSGAFVGRDRRSDPVAAGALAQLPRAGAAAAGRGAATPATSSP